MLIKILDIAIKNDGTICIIEGNSASDPDVVQMPDQIGKLPFYSKVLDKLERKQNDINNNF